ncbi:MAG: hypothetical protein J5895_02070 [Alphaproteobacteria bacterium]|nr:hypothetical protein [Alphaproteobacteria bacterium]
MKVFITDLGKIIKSSDFFEAHLLTLNLQERNRFEKITNQNRKLQFLAGRVLIKNAGIQNAHQTISGKLVADDVFLSLSHSKNYVMLATDVFPVGIDIEELNPNRDFQKTANRLNFKTPVDALDFYKMFTQYEADFKLGKEYKTPHHRFFVLHGFAVCLSSLKPIDDVSFYEFLPFQASPIDCSSSFCEMD